MPLDSKIIKKIIKLILYFYSVFENKFFCVNLSKTKKYLKINEDMDNTV